MVSGDAPAERFAGVRHASRSDQPPSVIRELARRGAVIGKATASHPRHPRHRPHQLAHLWWQSPAHYHYRSRHCPLAADSITPHWLINFFRDQNDPDCPVSLSTACQKDACPLSAGKAAVKAGESRCEATIFAHLLARRDTSESRRNCHLIIS